MLLQLMAEQMLQACEMMTPVAHGGLSDGSAVLHRTRSHGLRYTAQCS
jgi:hypothetical protein